MSYPVPPSVIGSTQGRRSDSGERQDSKWQADHVLAHSSGGGHARDNYLAAHSLCNNYRWDYSAEEFQWILKIGVWARYEMEGGGRLGKEILKRFFDYECSREKRRKIKGSAV
jgi:hypothetical protein